MTLLSGALPQPASSPAAPATVPATAPAATSRATRPHLPRSPVAMRALAAGVRDASAGPPLRAKSDLISALLPGQTSSPATPDRRRDSNDSDHSAGAERPLPPGGVVGWRGGK